MLPAVEEFIDFIEKRDERPIATGREHGKEKKTLRMRTEE